MDRSNERSSPHRIPYSHPSSRHPPLPPFEGAVSPNPLGLEPRLSISLGRARFTDLFPRSPLSPLPSRISLILVSRSPASTSRNSPFVSVSRDHLDHPLYARLSLSHTRAISLSLFHHVPPSSILPSRLPGFYLSLASTRSLSGNERRNTLATFNRPALSSAYTYLAGSVPPSLPTPSSSSPSSPPYATLDHPPHTPAGPQPPASYFSSLPPTSYINT